MKKTYKRLLAIIISVMILCSVYVPVNAESSGGFRYEVIQGSTSVRITGYTGIQADIVIPDIIDGRTVVEISSGAFASHSGVRSVEISSNVLRIMNDSFSNCSSLESVTIPASVSSIGDSAFAGCTALTDITISSASTAIGYYAFEGCTALKSVTIPSTKVGYAAFRNCSALETIRLLDSVQSIGRHAFDATAWHKSQPAGLLTVGKIVYQYNGDESSVVIPEGMRCIADYAFYGTDVESVVIPGGLYYIGIYAFANCNKMDYLSVPASVISIGTKAVGYVDNAAVSDFTVYCYDDSTAKAWAENNALKVQLIDECEPEYSEWVVTADPACEAEGEKTHRCIRCNITETESVEATGHSWSGWITISELSCTTDSIKRRTCTVCAKTEDDVKLTQGHTWGEWTVTKEADCVNEGERKHNCTVCNSGQTEKIEALGHSWIINETTDAEGWIIIAEPDCDTIGTKSRICTVCDITENQEIPAKGHVSNEWTVIKDPTALTPGEKEGVCSVCGETFIAEIPAIAVPMPDEITSFVLRDDATVRFNENETCLYGIKPGTTVNEVLLQFEYSGNILVTDTVPSKLSGEDVIGSGCFLFLVKVNPETGEEEPVDTTCVIIKGDLNGDGLVTAADAREALRSSAKLTTLLSPYFLAGDLDGDNNINASEARKILRVASKLETFE